MGIIFFTPYRCKDLKYSIFGNQKGKEYYKTRGFKEIMIYEGACEQSYRQTTENYKRRVHQKEIEIAHTSLHSDTKQEGNQIEQELKQISEQVLEENGFTKNGENNQQERQILNWDLLSKCGVKKAFDEVQKNAPLALEMNMKLLYKDYENPINTINISVDDVCSNRQKEKGRRKKVEKKIFSPNRKNGKKKYPKRKKLFQTVVHMESQNGSYVLYARKLTMVIKMIIAFLFKNNEQYKNWIFFVDGQRTLQDKICKDFAWKKIRLILDWYHLKKKISKELNMGVYRNERKDEILITLEQLAWYGQTAQAIDYINAIEEKQIKSQESLDYLAGYFERNKDYIPNYAVRKKLGLRNSSNIGEKMNDQVVSKRQKNNGMSWTLPGAKSLSLARTIKINKEKNNWLRKRKLSFTWAA